MYKHLDHLLLHHLMVRLLACPCARAGGTHAWPTRRVGGGSTMVVDYRHVAAAAAAAAAAVAACAACALPSPPGWLARR